MNIQRNVSLKDHSTMRLGGTAAYLVEVHSAAAVQTVVAWAEAHHLPIIMIGSGSNIVWKDEGFPGLVIVNKIMGYHKVDDESGATLTIGAGENWDGVVARATAKGLTGIEALSLIPGTAGATPVQNVGAYGQEIAQTLVSVTAYDCAERRAVTIQNTDCNFGYRMSRFKSSDRGRFFITAITVRLRRGNPEPPFYSALQQFLDAHHRDEGEITPQVVREAVIAIRQSKLPDPTVVANNGSFFANPIVHRDRLLAIEARYGNGEVPHWETDDGRIKLSAAWLLEKAGFKHARDEATGISTWPAQPLVLVNEHATSTADLMRFTHKIVTIVHELFGVTLEQEPELLPHTPHR